MMRRLAAACVLALGCSSLHASTLGEPWDSAAARNGVDPVLLYAVCLVESQTSWSDGLVRPDPYVVRIDGAVVRAGSAADLRTIVADAHREGRRVEDVGLCQIHWPSHKKRLASPELVVDPVANVSYAAEVLGTAIASTGDPIIGIGRYHSWTEWRARAYGYRVWPVYQRLQKAIRDGSTSRYTSSSRPSETRASTP